jgi:hypothetical protein
MWQNITIRQVCVIIYPHNMNKQDIQSALSPLQEFLAALGEKQKRM